MAERDSLDRERALAAVNALRDSLPEKEGDWEFDPSEVTLAGDQVGLLQLAGRIASQALDPKQDDFGSSTVNLGDDEAPLFLTLRSPDDLDIETEPPRGLLWGCGLTGVVLALATGYIFLLGLIQLFRQFFG